VELVELGEHEFCGNGDIDGKVAEKMEVEGGVR
jgi:hypothetical protein